MQLYIRYGLITLFLVILQTTIIPFTAIAQITPDLLIIWIIYIAIQHGQIPGTIAGFCIGLIVDFVGGQFLGITALSKTIAGFLAGYFFNENKTEQILGSYEFLIVTALASFIHNIIYFVISVQGSDISMGTAVFHFGLFSMLYTVAAALFPVFYYSRKIT
jgi:rod shape-determining protein MreD